MYFSRHPFDFHLGFDHTLDKISMTTIFNMMLLSSNHSTSIYIFQGQKRFVHTLNMLCSQCAYVILNHKVIPLSCRCMVLNVINPSGNLKKKGT